MTMGDTRVRVGFNPSGNPTINALKHDVSDLIDLIDSIDTGGNGEIARLKALAITNAELASMWAVKALTVNS